MKKTCEGCYAADTGCHPMCGKPHGCTLGYKTDRNGKPLEDCPKPKSWRELKKQEGVNGNLIC